MEKIRSPKNEKKTAERKMIPKEYETVLKEHLTMAQFLLLILTSRMLAKNTRYEIRKASRSLAINNLNGKSKKENPEIFKSGNVKHRKNLVSLCKRIR
jgi:hypothetical protein